MNAVRSLCAVALVVPASAAAEPPRSPASLFATPVISFGAGGAGFIASEMRAVTPIGEAWTARVALGGRYGIRTELSYTGSYQALSSMDGTALVANGVYATLRINVFPWTDLFEPFLYLGGGWAHYHVTGRMPGARLAASDDLAEFPLGLGAARRFGRFVVDLRMGPTITAGRGLIAVERDPSSSRSTAVMHRFEALATVGFQL